MNNLSIIVAFSAGVLSFLSPCVLPLIPAYIGYLTGSVISKDDNHKCKIHIFNKALGFVIGFSIIFVLMGASITYLGRFVLIHQQWLRKIGGILIFIFGIHTIGMFRIKLFYREKRFFELSVLEYSFNPILMGMAFAGGWTPCVGPILSSILIYSSEMETLSKGIMLLIFYSLGLAVPFILSALAIDSFTKYIRKYSKFLPIISMLSGALMIVMGIMVFMNKVNIISSYLNFINFY